MGQGMESETVKETCRSRKSGGNIDKILTIVKKTSIEKKGLQGGGGGGGGGGG